MSLVTDLRAVAPEGGFDAVICLGNSFAHLPDWHGDQRDHRWAFKEVINGGGFDAVICLGNSFAHLPDWHGDQRDHRWDF